MRQDLIRRLAEATKALDQKFTTDELLMMVYYDEDALDEYWCATEVVNVLEKYGVEIEDYVHYMYDTDILWDTLRNKVYEYGIKHNE